MIIKRLSSLGVFVSVVLFSYLMANGQSTPTTTTTTTTSSNPRVVITDNLSKPSTPSTQATTPTTSSTKIGKYNVNVTEGVTAASNAGGVTGQNLENGKYLTITKWDG